MTFKQLLFGALFIVVLAGYWVIQPARLSTGEKNNLASTNLSTQTSFANQTASVSTTSSNDDSLRAVQREYNNKILPTLRTHCGDCHWGPDAEADFNLEGFQTLDQLLNGRKKWKKTVVRVAAREMPPEGETPLTDADHQAVLQWIDNLLNSVDCTNINPGRVTIRRLNRTEYKNTIRDLVGINYEPANAFPGDDEGYGFNNIGDVLSLPPILMEKYLRAAEEIISEAISDPTVPTFSQTIDGNQFTQYDGSIVHEHESIHLMTTSGTINHSVKVPSSGQFKIEVRAYGDQAGNEPAKMRLEVSEKSAGTQLVRATADEHSDYEFTAKLKKGRNNLKISFLNDFYEEGKSDRNLSVVHVVLSGLPRGKTKSHRMLIPFTPEAPSEQRHAAREYLNKFMSRAYRRYVTNDELNRLMNLYDHAREDSESFESAVSLAFQAVLISPNFLYKIETPTAPGTTRHLNDFELATNLSYFLWSTMPDKELLKLASDHKLHEPEVYHQQIKRMLADPKADALVENYVSQWLQLRHLQKFTPDPDLFPGVDRKLRHDMATETKLMFADLIKRDASILEILDNDSTFLNERLANHYNIPGVKGDGFRQVSTKKYGRLGLMTQASILTLTSNPTRTSPVKRGKWIMENLLGEEPPPPDPAAMQLEDQAELKGTLRERMEQHRADPACAVCHKVMDQLGFALENYDAVGRWRENDEGDEIDASGELPDGTSFAGANELQHTLKTKMRDQFVRCATEKLLIYSLGRGLEYFDECSVDKIIEQLQRADHRFSELIIAVATSEPFLKRQGTPVDSNEDE